MRKLIRFTFVCSLLLLAASPSYALPCSTCIDVACESTPGSHTRCLPIIDGCETRNAPFCTGFSHDGAAPAMLAEWTIASVEISRPAEGTTVVTAPAEVAQSAAPQATLLK